jgi:hypothetical protein
MGIAFLGRRQVQDTSSPFQGLGFNDIRPVLNDLGEERFGVIELAGATGFFHEETTKKNKFISKTVLTGGLRLHGARLNLWLADEKSEREFWSALAQALPKDSPSQVWLSRRSNNLAKHYTLWQNQIKKQLKDHETGYAFLQDLLESLIYPVEDAGVSQDSTIILVAGRNEDEVAGRLASLLAVLPCDSTPCSAKELTTLLIDYFNPLEEQPRNPTPELILPQVLDFGNDFSNNGKLSAFWMLASPPAQMPGGWLRPVLEKAELAQTEFDIVAQLYPTMVEDSMKGVLVRRLISLDKQMQDDLKVSTAEIQRQKQDIEQRLVSLRNGAEAYFEIGVNLHLRQEPDRFEQTVEDFETVFAGEGISLRRISGQENLIRAWRTCAPLNHNQLLRPFVLPALGAGRLAQLFSGGHSQTKTELPLLGLGKGFEPYHFESEGHTVFLVGEEWQKSYESARNLINYLAVSNYYLQEKTVCGFDLNRQWVRTTQQVEGDYVAFGKHNKSVCHYNPLLAQVDKIKSLEGVAAWIAEVSQFCQSLLELSELETEQISTVLLELAISHGVEGLEINAENLYNKAMQSGYLALTAKLIHVRPTAKFGWLFSHPNQFVPVQNPFIFFGFDEDMIEEMPLATRRIYLAKVLQKLAFSHQILVLDEAHQLIAESAVSKLVAWKLQQGTQIWSVAPNTEEVATSPISRYLLEKSQTQVIFNHNGKALNILAARLKLTNRTLHALKLMLAGGAIVRQENGSLESFNPLPCDYIARQSRSLPSRRAETQIPAAAVSDKRESEFGEDITPLLQAPTSIQDFLSTKMGA